MSGLLTIKEIAQKLDMPESNIRYYRDKFESFLPYEGEGRKRRYRPEALEIFAFIGEQFSKNRSSVEVEKELGSRFAVNARPSDSSPQSGESREVPAAQDSEGMDHIQALTMQSQALQQMAEAVNGSRFEEKRLSRMERDNAKMKKALYLLWQDHKKTRMLPEKDQAEQGRLEALEKRVEDLARQQEELRSKFDQQMGRLQECMHRCQFWTKRIMLQFVPEEAEKFEGEQDDAGE